MNVRILATCRRKDLLDYTLLVFQSIRVGFPTARVIVTGNALPDFALGPVTEACAASGSEFENGQETIHHRYIDDLLEMENEPFVLSDTDIIYYSKVEDWKFNTALAGYRIPEFDDEFMGAITRSRLHTSLMFVDPVLFRKQWSEYESGFAVTPFRTIAGPCDPLCTSLNGRRYFSDTMSVAYHAIGGTDFTAEQKDSYFHVHFGTLEDLVLPKLTNGADVKSSREKVLANPLLGKGEWRAQYEHYTNRVPVFDGKDVVTPILKDEADKAAAWNYEVCKGNESAMEFGGLWYGYVHSIDDMIDSTMDGRAVMSKDQMISVFFLAALLYNHPFYTRNQHMLYPIILETTNLYKLSAGWENSSKPHRRAIADVLRSCGLKMHTMIALLCGGESHMIDITRRTYEEDYLRQHSPEGYPI